MPGQTTSPPLTVTVLAALWVSLGRGGVFGSPGPGCDNGKLSLDRDLPADAVYWDCPVSSWTKSSQRLSSIDTVYDPEPARPTCLDKPISYNYSIPNSGAYRPVSAERGEYLYCPPQRWLNNLHHGATVLLYHPCTPLHERLLLSALARSCLSDYILTPHHQLHKHMPVALVSWGRTLEASTVASSQICDWLESARSTRSQVSEVSHSRRYNLLLTWPAEQHWHSSKMKGSLKQCCEQTITQLLNEVMKAEQRSSANARGVGQMEEGDKSRLRRAADREDVEDDSKKDKPTAKVDSTLSNQTNEIGRNLQNYNSTISPAVHSVPGNRKASDHTAPREASRSEIPNQNLGLAPTPKNPLVSNISGAARDSDSSRFKASQFHKLTTKPSYKQSHLRNSKPLAGVDEKDNHSVRNEALTLGPKNEGTESSKQRDSDSKHSMRVKNSHKDTAADGKMKDNEVVDVEEREADPNHRYSHTHSHNKSEQIGFDSQQYPNPQPVSDTQDCGWCTAGEPCECPKGSAAEIRAAAVNHGLLRTPRTDEAVWAAAALGFLLVLLTLSVLHTRLYRHWRTAPSLYWHDPRQDYDSVADVIRRRMQISKRRRKRGRRQECVLLPSSSSSDDYP
ncbi:uncharacterized protein tp53i13 isoform X1 [Sphaeramia orbicularis]|uniref:Tumor protein p53-inducible protein 13 n=1 Tax=Sphaeramia orbicularis TaxID=375764 RepID=A0A673A2C9_9TELE|nr:tumor protein p53-inducible protein 13 isoform X1 [Sphaeramia orbicularis]